MALLKLLTCLIWTIQTNQWRFRFVDYNYVFKNRIFKLYVYSVQQSLHLLLIIDKGALSIYNMLKREWIPWPLIINSCILQICFKSLAIQTPLTGTEHYSTASTLYIYTIKPLFTTQVNRTVLGYDLSKGGISREPSSGTDGSTIANQKCIFLQMKELQPIKYYKIWNTVKEIDVHSCN